jgi:S1-C subfamily serine protease
MCLPPSSQVYASGKMGDDYNRRRGAMGFPVDYELELANSRVAETWRKNIYIVSKVFVIKISCESEGREIGFFNGFLYCDNAPYVITCGHIMEFPDVTRYLATTFDGTQLSSRVELTPRFYSLEAPDVAVFEYKCEVPPHTPRPLPTEVAIGQTVYVVGFKGMQEPQLTFTDGIVAHYDPFVDSLISCTAYADNGFSGSPVFNIYGFLVGMVHGYHGTTINQVKLVPALEIHRFLLSKNLPGLGQRLA